MATERAAQTATLLPDGQVLVAGGCAIYYCGYALANAELYDPNSGTWAATGTMTTTRAEQTATLLQNGTVLVVGGNTFEGILPSAEVYIP